MASIHSLRCWLCSLALAWLPLLAAAADPFTVPDTLAQRVAACLACHGDAGRATNAGYFPRIAGKPAGYLYNQLRNFRDGRRTNALMSPLLTNLSDAYLQEIADWFAGQHPPYAVLPEQPLPPDARARGEALVRHGDPARKVPACAACHGEALTGVAPSVPALLGLPRDYLNAQLGAWRAGQRKAAAPDCMHAVAERLAPEDITVLSGWLASQPVPNNGMPATTRTAPLPLTCGGVAP